ncbi:MAG TPA: polysaccharide deacetylase family protein [Terriglobales bacterium]|jgi:peptidoglycan/xylan/chitin deacetylase (PgdA/CDA1 family)|nr:polysaccharide deacetylase family protein [Terriglobales bacterium]
MCKKLLTIFSAIVFLLCPLYALSPADQPDLAQQADDIVAGFRKIIILTSDSSSLDDITRERVSMLGKMLFQQNEERLSALSVTLSSDPTKLGVFLDRLESNPDYHDADKLIFRDLLDDLTANLPQDKNSQPLKKRIAEDQAALDQIQALYQKELAKVFDQFQARGMPVRREAWEKYLAFIRQKYQREEILKEHEADLPEDETRGGGRTHSKKNRDELFGTELPPKTLLLTFDDGPHPRYTAQILEILKKYNLQAVFFEVGRNLGTVADDGTITLTKTADESYHILEAGSSIGNHSYTHALLPKLSRAKYSYEIETTNKLLKYILKDDPVLFRPPYGARNQGILQEVQSDKLKSMIWNIDSMDWADPVPNSVAQRVLQQVDHEGRGIILFHDIHRPAVEALPSLIETLQKAGYRFASWNGTGFSVSDSRGIQTIALPKPSEPSYRESWAAIIGIDNYQKWPKLRYAANDAQGVRDLLVQKYKFKPQNVFLLLDGDATRQNILSLLGDKLANQDMVKREDRVFVFYAGHGATRKLPSGRDLGYIIPVDADLENYQGQAISMTNFQDIAEAIPAKHLLFVMDSCYSGLALTRGGTISNSSNYLQEIARREAREMFTAGGADEQVADNGPNGHSVFTWTLLQALDGRGDLNGDGVITATELAAYVAPAVSALSHQTPAFGNMPGSEGGDFIFDLNHDSEFLNADSAQLGDDAIRLNSEVEKLRSQNEKLQQQLATAQAQLQQKGQTRSQAPSATETALGFNDEGLRLYKEKKYDEAFAKFDQAAALDPQNAEAANNVGFILYKLQKYEDSLTWFQKTIRLAPTRVVAYINLGDAYVKLERKSEAKQAYEKYLELAPNSREAAGVAAKLKALAP